MQFGQIFVICPPLGYIGRAKESIIDWTILSSMMEQWSCGFATPPRKHIMENN